MFLTFFIFIVKVIIIDLINDCNFNILQILSKIRVKSFFFPKAGPSLIVRICLSDGKAV